METPKSNARTAIGETNRKNQTGPHPKECTLYRP